MLPASATLLLSCAARTPAPAAPPPAQAAPDTAALETQRVPPDAHTEPADAQAHAVRAPDAPPARRALSCTEGPAYQAFAAVRAGRWVFDRSAGIVYGREDRVDGLAAGLRSARFEVFAVGPTDILPGVAHQHLALLRHPESYAGADRDEVSMAVLVCNEGTGWTPAAPPFRVADADLDGVPVITPTPLPGGGRALTVVTSSSHGESYTTAFLVGPTSTAYPVTEPRGGAVGILASFGAIGSSVVIEGGGGRFDTVAPFDATGWYPLGAERAYVRVSLEHGEFNHRWGYDARAAVLATLSPERIHVFPVTERVPEVWMLMGPGEPPAWCATRTDARCARLQFNGRDHPDARLRVAWIAGAWPVGAAVPREIRAPGARWLWVGRSDDDRPARGPDGARPMTFLPLAPQRGSR